MYTYIDIYTFIDVYLHTHIHTAHQQRKHLMYTCIRICMHICICIYIYTYICIQINICIHICIYVYIYTYMYTYKCMHADIIWNQTPPPALSYAVLFVKIEHICIFKSMNVNTYSSQNSFEMPMALSLNSGSFASNSNVSATFSFWIHSGKFWNPTNCEKFNADGSLMGRTNLYKSVW